MLARGSNKMEGSWVKSLVLARGYNIMGGVGCLLRDAIKYEELGQD